MTPSVEELQSPVELVRSWRLKWTHDDSLPPLVSLEPESESVGVPFRLASLLVC